MGEQLVECELQPACSHRCEVARRVGPLSGSPPMTCRRCGTVLIVVASEAAAGTGFWRLPPGETWSQKARLTRIRHVQRAADLHWAQQEPHLEPSVLKAIQAQRRALEAASRLSPSKARERLARERNRGVCRYLRWRLSREG